MSPLPRPPFRTKVLARVIGIAVMTSSSLAISCPFPDQPEPAGGGGQHDNRTCSGDANDLWKQGSIDIPTRIDPRKCPYSVNVSSDLLPFHFFVTVPRATLGPGTSNSLDITIFDVFKRQFYFNAVTFSSDPSNVNNERADVADSYQAGFGDASHLPRDSADFQVLTAFPPGLAEGWIILPGHTDFGLPQPSIIGPSVVNVAQPGIAWRVKPAWDTTSYFYQWRVNGVAAASGTGARFATVLPETGTYTVSAIVQRYDLTADTVTMTVSSVFIARIDGPSTVDPFVGTGRGTWTANVPGGYPPLTYQWTADGRVVGSQSSLTEGWNPGASHTIALRVQDSHNHVATDSRSVFVTQGGRCLQLPCP